MAILEAGANLAYERGHFMEGGVGGADAEDALDHNTGLGDGRIAIARDEDHTVDVALQKGGEPVGNELATRSRARITQVLSVGQLALFERRVEEVIGNSQLNLQANEQGYRGEDMDHRTFVKPVWENATFTPESLINAGVLPCSFAAFLLLAILVRSCCTWVVVVIRGMRLLRAFLKPVTLSSIWKMMYCWAFLGRPTLDNSQQPTRHGVKPDPYRISP